MENVTLTLAYCRGGRWNAAVPSKTIFRRDLPASATAFHCGRSQRLRGLHRSPVAAVPCVFHGSYSFWWCCRALGTSFASCWCA